MLCRTSRDDHYDESVTAELTALIVNRLARVVKPKPLPMADAHPAVLESWGCIVSSSGRNLGGRLNGIYIIRLHKHAVATVIGFAKRVWLHSKA